MCHVRNTFAFACRACFSIRVDAAGCLSVCHVNLHQDCIVWCTCVHQRCKRWCREAMNRLQEAIEDYKEAVVLEPKSKEALSKLSSVRQKLDDCKKDVQD